MGNKVLVTGSNGGFGRLIIETLLKEGHQVAASMRGVEGKNQEAAEQLKELGAHVVEIDVTSDESVNSGVSEAANQLGGLDIVVNNAGVGVSGMQEQFTVADWQKVFDVNVFGVQRVNRAIIPHLRNQGSGLIIYISSLLGRMSLPFYGPYNATKWALEAMAENYRVELSGFGIENAIVEPGGFETSFFGNLIQPSDTGQNEAYAELSSIQQQMGQAFGEALANNSEQDPQKVADAVLSVINQPVGQKPFRTTVDHMGMGDAIKPYNDQLEQVTQGIYGNFQLGGLLSVSK